MTIKDSIRQCLSLSVQSPKLLLVGIMIIALCAVSCKTSKMTTETSTVASDSLTEIRKKTRMTEAIPPQRVSLSLPVDSMKKLPLGSCYTKKSNLINIKISRDKYNNLLVEAETDSIPVKHTEEIIETKNIHREVAKVTKPPNIKESRMDSFWIITGRIFACIIGIVAIILIVKKKFNI